jgi:hypothetical protein
MIDELELLSLSLSLSLNLECSFGAMWYKEIDNKRLQRVQKQRPGEPTLTDAM